MVRTGRRAAPILRRQSNGGRLDQIALQAADGALMSVLTRLDEFRGLSRFGCPACREEHESLRAVVGGEQAL